MPEPKVVSMRRTRSRRVTIYSNGIRVIKGRGDVTLVNLSMHNRRRPNRQRQPAPQVARVSPRVRTINIRAANARRVHEPIDLDSSVPRPVNITNIDMLSEFFYLFYFCFHYYHLTLNILRFRLRSGFLCWSSCQERGRTGASSSRSTSCCTDIIGHQSKCRERCEPN